MSFGIQKSRDRSQPATANDLHPTSIADDISAPHGPAFQRGGPSARGRRLTGDVGQRKMKLSNLALFESSLPDDSVEVSGDITVPAGRNVMESLSQRFKESGINTSVVSRHSFYGWSFEAWIDDRRFWFLIQCPSPWLLIVDDRRGFFRRVLEGEAPFRAALKTCDAALRALGHASEIEWLTQAAYEARGRAKFEQRSKQPIQRATDNDGAAPRRV